MRLPEFETKSELFDYLRKNKKLLVKAKKSAIKYADAMVYKPSLFQTKDGAIKSIELTDGAQDIESIIAKLVINTTNLMDSHSDVHIPGLWKKTISEQKSIYLLQEHSMKFESVISDEVKASTAKYSFKDLGYPELKGQTEALIFDAVISEDRNEFMFEQYLNGWVKNHSVGMQYVQLLLCINSESKMDAEEKANWDKYYPMIANSEVADEQGYFWAVLEAKLIEGSAVLKGSNYATPTLDVTIGEVTTEDDMCECGGTMVGNVCLSCGNKKSAPFNDTQKQAVKTLVEKKNAMRKFL